MKVFKVRVYYEDTDAGGIVYHANYLKFTERARTEFLRELGIEQDEYIQQNIIFVVSGMNIKFHLAAKFNQQLSVNTEINKIKGASIDFYQTITDTEGQLIFSAEVRVACVDSVNMRPIAIPKTILEVLNSAV